MTTLTNGPVCQVAEVRHVRRLVEEWRNAFFCIKNKYYSNLRCDAMSTFHPFALRAGLVKGPPWATRASPPTGAREGAELCP